MTNLRQLTLLLPVFVFVSAFQNCSIHKSEGRKYVENGTARSVIVNPPALGASAPQAKANSTCEPYINDASASEAMGVFSSTKIVFNSTSESVACVISANEASKYPALDVVVCSVSANNLQLLQNAPDQSMVLDPYGPLSRGSLGFSRKLSSGATQFVFVGSSDSAMEAVACQVDFESEVIYQANLEQVIDRTAHLVHEIHRNLR